MTTKGTTPAAIDAHVSSDIEEGVDEHDMSFDQGSDRFITEQGMRYGCVLALLY